MEKLWLDVKRVAGQSVIFEAPKDCPRRSVANCKTASSADVERAIHRWFIGFATFSRRCPLLACEVVPSQEETLAQTAPGLQNGGPTILPGWHWLFRVRERTSQLCASHTRRHFRSAWRFSTTRYSLAIRQEVCAMMD